MKAGREILYISFDGILEPLGESQVLQYLLEMRRLSPEVRITLLSYEKARDWQRIDQRTRLEGQMVQAQIRWHPKRYHFRPRLVASAWDFLSGCVTAAWLCVRYRVSVVHTRSFMASLIGLVLQKALRRKWIFDIRGFWTDERVDCGSWQRASWIYKILNPLERWMYRQADHVVTLTNASLPYLPAKATMIPCCVDLDRFSLTTHKSPEIRICYLGSVSHSYAFDPAMRSMQILLRLNPSMRFEVFNRDRPDFVRTNFEAYGLAHHADIQSLRFDQVPQALKGMTGSLFFIPPTYSKIASCPTKMAEVLASGIPILTNRGVGDVEEILSRYRVGICVADFDSASLEVGCREFVSLLEDPGVRQRCRQAAEEVFSLAKGSRAYLSLYRQLTERRASSAAGLRPN